MYFNIALFIDCGKSDTNPLNILLIGLSVLNTFSARFMPAFVFTKWLSFTHLNKGSTIK